MVQIADLHCSPPGALLGIERVRTPERPEHTGRTTLLAVTMRSTLYA
jgi:hypothetical protein